MIRKYKIAFIFSLLFCSICLYSCKKSASPVKDVLAGTWNEVSERHVYVENNVFLLDTITMHPLGYYSLQFRTHNQFTAYFGSAINTGTYVLTADSLDLLGSIASPEMNRLNILTADSFVISRTMLYNNAAGIQTDTYIFTR